MKIAAKWALIVAVAGLANVGTAAAQGPASEKASKLSDAEIAAIVVAANSVDADMGEWAAARAKCRVSSGVARASMRVSVRCPRADVAASARRGREARRRPRRRGSRRDAAAGA